MTTIHYERAGGFEPPRDHEVLDIDTPGANAGAFTLWRSVGWTTHPATPVGRFSGLLDSEQNALLQDEAAAAERAGTVLIPIPPDSPIETIVVGQAQAMMGVHTDAGAACGVLTAHLRLLLVALTQSPQAALALVLAPDGRAARLVHQGSNPLLIDLSALTIRAFLWDGRMPAREWVAQGDIIGLPDRLTVSGGMSFELPFNHGFDLTYRHRVTARVELVIYDGATRVPVSLYAP